VPVPVIVTLLAELVVTLPVEAFQPTTWPTWELPLTLLSETVLLLMVPALDPTKPPVDWPPLMLPPLT